MMLDHRSKSTMSAYIGKVALITGGGQGIGKAFASALLHRGAKVGLVDIDRKLGAQTETEFKSKFGEERAIFLPCDVTDKNQLESAFDTTRRRLGGLDIVINNAGIADEINWEKTILVDLNAVIRGTYLGVKSMRVDGGGRGGVIINVASVAAMVATPACPAYTAAKHGVLGFTRSLAETVPVDAYGIRFCCLCPTFAQTNILEKIFEAESTHPKEWLPAAHKLRAGMDILGLMKPEDVVKGMFTLLEDDRNHGAVLTVTPAGLEYKAPKHLKGKL